MVTVTVTGRVRVRVTVMGIGEFKEVQGDTRGKTFGACRERSGEAAGLL